MSAPTETQDIDFLSRPILGNGSHIFSPVADTTEVWLILNNQVNSASKN